MSAESLQEFEAALEHDESEHPDERWLISYADMMTLLFGLFVLLYSMADQMDVVEKAARKEFSDKEVQTAPANTPPASELKEENSQEKLLLLQKEVGELLVKVAGLEAALKDEKAKAAEAGKGADDAEDLKEQLAEKERELKELQALRSERDELRSKLLLLEADETNSRAERERERERRQREQETSSGGGGRPLVFYARGTLPSGEGFQSRVSKISPEGCTLEQAPSGNLKRPFKVQIVRDDGSVAEVLGKIIVPTEGDEDTSVRMRFIRILSNDKDMRNWVKGR